MITTDLVAIHLKGSPTQGGAGPRDRADKWMAETAAGRSGSFELVDVLSCPCCGEPAWPNGRCTRHQDRNPCIIEGCKRTRAAKHGLSLDNHVCGEHWRRYVPPGSRQRRTIQAVIRKAKKAGFSLNDRWPPHLERQYWIAWRLIVRRARRLSTEGFLDEKEIARMMGWE